MYRPSPYTAPSLQDQLASLKAFYEAKGAGVGPGLGSPLLPPGLSLPVSALPGFPRPPVSSLPPFLGLGPGAGRRHGQAIAEGCNDRDAMQWREPGRLRAICCSYVRCATS